MIRQFTKFISHRLQQNEARIFSSSLNAEPSSNFASKCGHYSIQRLHHDSYNDFTVNKLMLATQTTIYGCYRHHSVTIHTLTGNLFVEKLSNELDFPGSGEELKLSGGINSTESITQISKNSPFYVKTGDTETVAIIVVRPAVNHMDNSYINYEKSGTHTFL